MAILVLVMLFSLIMVAVASASHGVDPIGLCPIGFQLHHAADHDDHHGHRLVGTATDRNGDGRICVKHVSVDRNIHVHVDNNI